MSTMLARLLLKRRVNSRDNACAKPDKSASLPNIKLDARRVEPKASSLQRVPSANINIPLKKSSSDRASPRRRHAASPQWHTNSSRVLADGEREGTERCRFDSSEALVSSAWRKHQRQCANCEQISYQSMPDVRLGDFCSLDCKTSHRYMRAVRVAVDEQLSSLVDTWVDDDCSSPSLSVPSSGEGDAIEVGQG